MYDTHIWPLKIDENFVAREWIRGNSDEAMGGVLKLRRHDVAKTFSPWTSLGGTMMF
jgi:hypothetical protein